MFDDLAGDHSFGHQYIPIGAHAQTKRPKPVQRPRQLNRKNRLLHPPRLRHLRVRVPGPNQFDAWRTWHNQRELSKSYPFWRRAHHIHVTILILYVRVQIHQRQEKLLVGSFLGNPQFPILFINKPLILKVFHFIEQCQ